MKEQSNGRIEESVIKKEKDSGSRSNEDKVVVQKGRKSSQASLKYD